MASPLERRIAIIEGGYRFWIFPQVQGALKPLREALDLCRSYFQSGDRFVFLGSQIGAGGQSPEVMEELIGFKAWAADASDGAHAVIWLRGIQEELIERLFTLHMAQDPAQVLNWMVSEHRLDRLINQFGFNLQEFGEVAVQGAAPLAKYTAQLNEALRAHDGVAAYFDQCARAAVSDQGHLLFVHGGVDPARTLSLQTDAFWWGHPDFFRLRTPYQNFERVVSTLTGDGKPRLDGPGRVAIDPGCGRGGSLSTLCLDSRGQELFAYDFAE